MGDWSQNTITIIVAIIGAVGVITGTGGVLVALINRNRTASETSDNNASAKVKQAEAESIAVATLQIAVAEVRKLAAEKDGEISELRREMVAERISAKQEAEENANRVALEMSDMKAELRELRKATDDARRAWGMHSQWDWNLYHWAKTQGMPDLEEPPPMVW